MGATTFNFSNFLFFNLFNLIYKYFTHAFIYAES